MRMKTKYLPYICAAGFLALTACEQEIEIDLPPPKEMVVVDGSIESGEFARVTLTKSMPYFSEIDPNTLSSILITDATVFISDGTLTDTLEFTIDFNAFPPVYYKGTNPLLQGVPGKSYNLTIWTQTDTLTAVTSIPQIVPLDSIFWKPDGDEQDSLGYGWGHLTDPPEIGNIYRLFVKRQDYISYIPAGGRSTMDDRLINGQSTDFNFVRPRQYPSWYPVSDTTSSGGGDERFYFKRGDTISVKFCTIDVASYDFVRTYEIAAGSFGNPFSAPTFVRTNITGGLGGWVGYGVSHHSYVVPE